MNDELLGMISGTFDQSRTPRREHSDLPQLIVREDDELPEHRFVVKEDSGKITLFIGDNISEGGMLEEIS